MALTQQFKQTIKAAPTPGTVPHGQPMTPEQFQSWAGASPQQPNAFQQMYNQAASGAKEFASSIDSLRQAPEGRPQDVQAALKGGGPGAATAEVLGQGAEMGVQGVAKLGHAVGALGSVATAPFAPLFNAGTKIGQTIGNAVPEKQAMQFADTLNKNPGIEKAASTGMDLANLAIPEGASKGAEILDTGISKARESVKPAEVTPSITAKASVDTAKANALKAHDMIDKEVRNVGEKYGDVGKALNHAEVTKGTEPIKVLASYPEGKALPSMSSGGKMNSLPAINYLRKQVSALGKVKGDLVDTAKQNISTEDFQKTIEDKIDSSHGSQAAKDAQKADIANEMDRLKKSYPDGIPTKEMDKLKTEHANESSSYKTTGFPSRFAPDTHSLIADTARKLVEEQGGEAPIDELNKWITSHHDAIKVLEKMHGKTPHGGMFSRHVGGIAGEIAGLAGGMALGHPFLGAMAGRGASEVVNNILSSHFISNPLKRSIIENMKGASPEVIQKALDFISESEGTSPTAPTAPASPAVPESTSPNDSKPPPKVQGAIPETSQIIKQATEYQPEFEKAVDEIAKIGEWEVHHGPVKTEERATDKIDTEGGLLRDANRSTIVVKDPSQLASVLEAVNGIFGKETRVKDKFQQEGYKSAIINVKTPAGHEAEIAVTTPEMWEAKKMEGDKMYNAVRDKIPGWEDIETQMLKLYQDAALRDADALRN